MNEAYTTDFIARCIAAEALEKAEEGGTSNVADVNASVSGSELTIQLEDSEGTPVGSGSTVNLPNGLPSSTSADEGKVLTVNSSGNAEWDESKVNVFRTAYRSVLDDYTSSYDSNGNWILTFEPEVSFEKLDVYLQWHFDWSAGTDWPLRTATRSIMLSLTKDVAGPVVSTGMNLYLANSVNQPNNPNSNILYDVLMGSINVNYDAQTNTVTMLVAKPLMDAVSDPGNDKNNIPVVMTNCVANAFGYVAYGSDDYVVYDGLQAGTGLDLDGNVMNLDINYGASFELSINSSTYVMTATLKDQNGNTLGQPQTVDLPLESVVVGGSYDDTTKKIVLTLQNGNTVEFSVADLVDGLESSSHAAATYQTIAGMSAYETTAHASSTYQTQAGMSAYETSAHAAQTYQPIGSYATTSDISDMATETWVNQQGYLTDANEVPDVGSSDDGKVLTASYTGGVGSYSWQNASSGGLQVETDGTNYWITVNNVRLYFANVGDPVGNIPDGSVGIGWTGMNGVN